MKLMISAAALAACLTFGVSSASAADDAVICQFMKEAIDGFNGDGPHLVDEVTRVETGSRDCDTKTVDFRWSILVEAPQLNDGWQETLKKQFSGVFCGVEGLPDALEAGWTANATWTTSDAEVFTTGITCT